MTDASQTLARIEAEIRELEAALADADDERLDELLEVLLEQRSSKVDAIFGFIKRCEAEEAYARELADLAKARLNRVRRIKDQTKMHFLRLMQLGVVPEKLSGELYAIRRQRNSAPSIEVSDTAPLVEWPEQFRRIEVLPDKAALVDAFKSGQELPPGVHAEVGYHLRFGNAKG